MTGRVTLLAIFCLLLAHAAPAQEVGAIRGTVVDAKNGAALGNAVVWLGRDRRAETDAEGRFSLCRLREGPVHVAVQAAGYAAASRRVEVRFGDTVSLTVGLEKPLSGAGVALSENRDRTTGQPLILVDGERAFYDPSGCGDSPPGVRSLYVINPSEIHELKVLKGPEAVPLYGPEAEHGVIMITMKVRQEPS